MTLLCEEARRECSISLGLGHRSCLSLLLVVFVCGGVRFVCPLVSVISLLESLVCFPVTSVSTVFRGLR